MNNQLAIEHYNNGLQYVKEEKWDEALEVLNKAITEDPKHVNSYNILGEVYNQKGDTDAARRCWRMALRIDPDNATAKQYLVSIDKRSARFQPKTLIWPVIVIILILALIVTNLILLRRISKLENELAKARTAQQTQGIQSTKPVEAAIEDQKDRQTLSPEPKNETSIRRPQPTKLPKLETTLQVTELYNQALADCMSGHYDRAIEAFLQILEYRSTHQLKDNAQYWLAECYYAQKNYIRALSEFQKVKEFFPKADKVFDAELKIAYTYYKLGRIEAAEQKLLQISKDWSDQQYQSKIAVLSEKIQSSQSE